MMFTLLIPPLCGAMLWAYWLAMAPPDFYNAHGQPVWACTTDSDCETKNPHLAD